MTGGARFRWGRVIAAIILAEALPILLLVAVVFVYGFHRKEGSPSPAEFAPRAGNWVGPIGGFVATFLFAWWAARRAPARKLAHGTAVGIGAALLDFGLALLLAGTNAIQPLLFVSNCGRILAGVLGGGLALRSAHGAAVDVEVTRADRSSDQPVKFPGPDGPTSV
jgi:hypothetical protein